MQARVDWVLIIFKTQVIKKKWPVRPVFPDYLSVSYDYGLTLIYFHLECKILVKISDSVLKSALALRGKEGDIVREKLKAYQCKGSGKN